MLFRQLRTEVKNMKISCTPISVSTAMNKKELNQAQYFELIAAAGAEATDIVDPACYPWFYCDVEKDKAALKSLLKAYGLDTAAYATSNNFTVREPERFAMQTEKVINAVRDAADMEIPLLRIFGGYHKSLNTEHQMDYAEGLQYVIRGIETVLPEAEKLGVVLALENHGRLPGLAGELQYIMKYFNSDNLGLCFDIANFTANNMNEKADAIEAYTMLKKYIRHVHCKDWANTPAGSPRPQAACVCGKGNGNVPLRQLAYMMEEDGYSGYWALEYEGPGIEGVTESLQYMKSLKEVSEMLYGRAAK